MSILRNKLKENFSQIPNNLITDMRLSFGAKIVAVYLFSKPDGWLVYNKDIQNNLGIKNQHTLAKYWKELIESGWVTRVERRDEGKFKGGYDYELIVNTEMLVCGNAENTRSGKNSIHSKTDIINNTNSKQQEDEAFRLYNQLAGNLSLPKATKLTEARRCRIRQRLKDCGGVEGWEKALSIIETSPFLCGQNSREWKADIDFILNESSFAKIVKGKYSSGIKPDTTRSKYRKVL